MSETERTYRVRESTPIHVRKAGGGDWRATTTKSETDYPEPHKEMGTT